MLFIKQLKLHIYGRVQGVGFRPSVCRLAQQLGLRGLVRNLGNGVEIMAAGPATKLQTFAKEIQNLERPVFVEKLVVQDLSAAEFNAVYDSHSDKEFYVVESSKAVAENLVVPADIGICRHCETELLDKNNRRFGYPYISCAQCGPRYSTIRNLPYDRGTTTMDEFQMCAECAEEYNNMEDRRGRAETISCWHCGPQLQGFVKGNEQALSGDDAIAQACTLLQQGKIIIAKTLGGFNLLCRADDESVVQNLRDLKQRSTKPFVVVFPDMARAKELCQVSDQEAELLTGGVRPIVLLQKRSEHLTGIADNVAGGTPYLGVFLPPLGLYSLLVKQLAGPFVATSCNFSGSPIIIDDQEAQSFYQQNEAVAGFFTYNRIILRPADDSVVQVLRPLLRGREPRSGEGVNQNGKLQILRRTRGYMPEPITSVCLPVRGGVSEADGGVNQVLAVGSQMEPGFCLSKGDCFYPAQVPGEAGEIRTANQWHTLVDDWQKLLHIHPQVVVADLHPDYDATHWAQQLAQDKGLPLVQVQHHQAHVLSVVAEQGLQGPVLGVAFDGTGYGADGTVWGGEFLLCNGSEYERVAHLEPTLLMGGDDSMHQAWKSALAYRYAADLYPENMTQEQDLIKAALKNKVNTIPNSSMGRVFDAVASLLGLGDVNTHQGCCAQRLEAAAVWALEHQVEPLQLSFVSDDQVVYSPKSLWQSLLQVDKKDYAAVAATAIGFHYAVADMVLQVAKKIRTTRAVTQVALTGGCFVNRVLCQRVRELLTKNNFRVYINEQVSPGDGGIALGQAYYGDLMMEKGGW